jgi:hypothetical protein
MTDLTPLTAAELADVVALLQDLARYIVESEGLTGNETPPELYRRCVRGIRDLKKAAVERPVTKCCIEGHNPWNHVTAEFAAAAERGKAEIAAGHTVPFERSERDAATQSIEQKLKVAMASFDTHSYHDDDTYRDGYEAGADDALGYIRVAIWGKYGAEPAGDAATVSDEMLREFRECHEKHGPYLHEVRENGECGRGRECGGCDLQGLLMKWESAAACRERTKP